MSSRVSHRKLAPWLPALAWLVFIFWLSSCSHLRTPGPEFQYKDKIGHWALYCILGGLIAYALRRASTLSLPKTIVLAIVLSSAYGAFDEVYQRRVPHRRCDATDWLADTLGAAAAAMAFYVYESARSTKTNR